MSQINRIGLFIFFSIIIALLFNIESRKSKSVVVEILLLGLFIILGGVCLVIGE
jgi:UDP-N-acetylmuramyl pentapeptide phosphotransferase/UDP-N-acetylglucosamine-1-phosphate transferase